MSLLTEILGVPREDTGAETNSLVVLLWCIIGGYILISIW
jgi:hypothetical protein